MEAHDSSLNFFNKQALNKAIIQSQIIEHLPISQLGNDCIEFSVTSQNFIDLSRSKLYLKCKVVTGESGAIKEITELEKYDKTGDVAPVNCLFTSLFSKVDFTLQQKNISSDIPKYCFPYKAHLDKILTSTTEEDPAVLFTKDLSTAINACSNWKAVTGVPDNAVTGGNPGLKKRAAFMSKGQSFEMMGPLNIDFCKQEKLLLHNVNIGMKLWPSSPEFNLLATEKDQNFNVKILDAKLLLCHVTLDTGVSVAIAEALQLSPAQYPFVTSKCRTFTIPKGNQSATFTDLFTSGSCPDEMIVCLVSSSAFNGSLHHNPFSYKHGSLSEIGYYVNNTSLPSRPLQLKFGESAHDSHYIEAWQRIKDANPNTVISFEDFHRGYSIFTFNLRNGEENGLIPVGLHGTSKLELRFAEALDDTLVVFVYGKFRSNVSIDSSRNITVQ